jgi:hypothetical protein
LEHTVLLHHPGNVVVVGSTLGRNCDRVCEPVLDFIRLG